MARALRARVLLRPRSPLLVLATGLLGARDALACPACAIAQEQTREAFVNTTVLLTILPLVLIGTIVWWLGDRARQAAREDLEDVPPTEPPAWRP